MTGWAIHRGGHWLSSVGWRVNAEGATRYDSEDEAERRLLSSRRRA